MWGMSNYVYVIVTLACRSVILSNHAANYPLPTSHSLHKNIFLNLKPKIKKVSSCGGDLGVVNVIESETHLPGSKPLTLQTKNEEGQRCANVAIAPQAGGGVEPVRLIYICKHKSGLKQNKKIRGDAMVAK
jgi:hypothetical protein